MKILMIGGTGIISSEICSLSIERGHDVTIVNRGKRKSLINEKAHLIVADVRQESAEQIKEKIGQSSYDVVVDFISYNVGHVKKMLEVINVNSIFLYHRQRYIKKKIIIIILSRMRLEMINGIIV